MWIIFFATALVLQLARVHAQNVCTPTVIANCGRYPCVQTDTIASCLCSNLQLGSSAAQCDAISPTTAPVVVPNICGNAYCPAGATCIPTNQNPVQYVCLCPNNILANPDCPNNPLPNNPCLISNPCYNGGTCVVNTLTLQAVCLCPPNTYGSQCASSCSTTCSYNW